MGARRFADSPPESQLPGEDHPGVPAGIYLEVVTLQVETGHGREVLQEKILYLTVLASERTRPEAADLEPVAAGVIAAISAIPERFPTSKIENPC